MIERHDTLWDIAPEWEALADAAKAPPFSRPGWIAAWIDAFGRGRTVVLAVRREDRLVAVVPLLVRRGRISSPTNSHTPVFDLLALDRDGASELAEGVMALGGRIVGVSFLDPDEEAFAAWRAAVARRRHHAFAWVVARAPYVPLYGEWSDYQASLNRKFRKELGRLTRRLEDCGRVEFMVDEGSDRWPELLEEGLRIEGSGWKDEAGTAILSQADTARFYREVATWAAGRGWLRLRRDGLTVAFGLVLEADGVAHVLKDGFDPTVRRLGPGTVLTGRSLERAFEQCQLPRAARHRRRLQAALDQRDTRAAHAFPPSVVGTVAHLAADRGQALYRRARGRAPAERLGVA